MRLHKGRPPKLRLMRLLLGFVVIVCWRFVIFVFIDFISS
jgi:hypothetical protein